MKEIIMFVTIFYLIFLRPIFNKKNHKFTSFFQEFSYEKIKIEASSILVQVFICSIFVYG